MADADRQDVVGRDRARRALRESLLSQVKQAKHDLHPRTLSSRWTNRQKEKLTQAGQAAKQTVEENAPAIGIGAAAILLFAARKPIWKLVQCLRNRRPASEDEKL